jgi:AmmeMemoRadiSam system protein B
MRIREYSLPAGWYPRDSEGVSEEISRFMAKFGHNGPYSRAAISPHAGWYYSGQPAFRAIASLDPGAETVVVLGGHLSPGSPFLFAMEDAVRTPLDLFSIDAELRAALNERLDHLAEGCAEDRYRDNTIEVLLPMVRFFFRSAQLVWLRLPSHIASYEAGKIIAQTAAQLGRKIDVLASTDLTHYGNNYGFSPKGAGQAALNWVREENDASFIKAIESGDVKKVLHCGERDRAACSSGAVLGAMGFAEEAGIGSAHLLEYSTSADKNEGEGVPDSFVGYAALSFGS